MIPAPAPSSKTIIIPRSRDLGGFEVRRAALPSSKRQMVGAFIFLGRIGPSAFSAGDFDVRPHPHINLATVTYLFEGEIMHRDCLGSEVAIRPGAVNWMTAGREVLVRIPVGRGGARNASRPAQTSTTIRQL